MTKLKKNKNYKSFFLFAALILLNSCSKQSSNNISYDYQRAMSGEQHVASKEGLENINQKSQAYANYITSQFALNLEKNEKAVKYISKAYSSENSASTHLTLDTVYLQLLNNQKDSAADTLSKFNSSDSKSSNFLLTLKALIELQNGESEKAGNTISKINSNNKSSIIKKKYLKLAHVLSSSGVNSALEYLKKNQGNDHFDLFYKARLEETAEDYKSATETLKSFLAKNPPLPRAFSDISRLYAIDNNKVMFGQMMRVLLSVASTSPELQYLKHNVIKNSQCTCEAFEECACKTFLAATKGNLGAKKLDFNLTDFIITEGARLLFSGRSNANEGQMLLSLIEEDDKMFDYCSFYIASSLASKNQKNSAIKKLLQIKEDSILYELSRSTALLLYKDLNRTKEAIQIANNLYEKTGKLNYLAIVSSLQMDAEEYNKAIKTLTELTENQTSINNFFNLAVAYDKVGKKEKTIKTLKRVLELDPNNGVALNYLGYTYAEQKTNLDEAKKIINKALEKEPNNGYYIDSLAWVYYQEKDYKKSSKLLKKALEYVPNDAVILEHYGLSLLKQGKRKLGEFYLKRALSNSDQSDDKDVKKRVTNQLQEIKKR